MMFCGLRIKAVGVRLSYRVVDQTLSSNSLVQTLISFATCLTRRLKNTTSKFLLFEHFVGLVPLGRIPPGGESRLARGVEHRAHSLLLFFFLLSSTSGLVPLGRIPQEGTPDETRGQEHRTHTIFRLVIKLSVAGEWLYLLAWDLDCRL